MISNFADDTKMAGLADSEEHCQRIQNDIDRLEIWAKKWQMEFNPDKCKVLVVTLPEGHRGFGESTEEVYQDAAWYGGV